MMLPSLRFLLAAPAAIALAACGANGSSPPPKPATVTNSRTVTQATVKTVTEKTPAATTTTRGRTTSAPRDPKCVPKDLGIHFAGVDGAAGSLYTSFQFVNVSRHECHLLGYPGMAAYRRSGRRLPVMLSRDHSRRPRLVRLAAGGRAGFSVKAIDNPAAGRCLTAYRLRFTPPDDYSSLEIRRPLRICGPRAEVTISPVERPR